MKAEHIDEIIELASSHKSSSSLAGVKIRLYEIKRDYQKAFMEHLNDPAHFKYVFTWLTETFDMLLAEEREWKKKMGYEVIHEESSESEAHSHGDHSSSDCSDDEEEHKKSSEKRVTLRMSTIKNAMFWNSQVGSNVKQEEFKPLKRLKDTVKEHMRKLVQQNSEQTVELIENYLSDGNYQEELIMN